MWTKDEINYGPLEDLVKEIADQVDVLHDMKNNPNKYPSIGILANGEYMKILLVAGIKRIDEMKVSIERIRKSLPDLFPHSNNN